MDRTTTTLRRALADLRQRVPAYRLIRTARARSGTRVSAWTMDGKRHDYRLTDTGLDRITTPEESDDQH